MPGLTEDKVEAIDTSIEQEVTIGSVTFRMEWVRCGKKACSKCPHGPYWYAYGRRGGKAWCRYIGKEFSPVALAPKVVEHLPICGEELVAGATVDMFMDGKKPKLDPEGPVVVPEGAEGGGE